VKSGRRQKHNYNNHHKPVTKRRNILNKTTQAWGAYSYKPENDLLRFTVKPVQAAEKQESFAILFTHSTTESVQLNIAWDKTIVPIQLKVDDDAQISANNRAGTSIGRGCKTEPGSACACL
jgi:hypothetical protein